MDIRSVGSTTQSSPSPVEKKATEPSSALASAVKTTVDAVDPAIAVQPPTMVQVTDAVNSINQAMTAMSHDLEFSVDEESDRTIIKIVDQKTKEVLLQIPSVEALAIAKALDQAQGLLIKQKA